MYLAFNLPQLGLREPKRTRLPYHGIWYVFTGIVKTVQIGPDHQAELPEAREKTDTKDRSILQKEKDVFDLGFKKMFNV